MARGAISSAQLETVVYAGMRFQHQLPNGALPSAGFSVWFCVVLSCLLLSKQLW